MKLQKNKLAYHFIPYSFVKDDRIWNFVLSCLTCSVKKYNRVLSQNYLIILENRYRKIQLLQNTDIKKGFNGFRKIY